MKNILKNINYRTKISIIISMTIIFIGILVLPTLSKHRNQIDLNNLPIWDGTVADSFKEGTGTVEDPYIISNGSELAYFFNELENDDFSGKYIKQTSNIAMNEGVFTYTDNNLKYILNGNTYYLKEYTNNYYEDVNYENSSGTVNMFSPLKSFKGNYDGGSYTIFGLYITSDTEDNVALFKNLSGTLHDAYIENTLVYGGHLTAGIASIATNANIYNTLFGGTVVGSNQEKIEPVFDIVGSFLYLYVSSEINETITVPYRNIINDSIHDNTYTIEVNLSNGTLDDVDVEINGERITSNPYTMETGTNYLTEIPVVINSPVETEVEINITYRGEQNSGSSSGIVAAGNNTTLRNVINKGNIFGKINASGLIAVAKDSNIISSYNEGNITADMAGGLISTIYGGTNSSNITNSYNKSTIINGGALVGIIKNNKTVNITNAFDTSSSAYKIYSNDGNINITSSYKVSGNDINIGILNGSFTTSLDTDLKDKIFMTGYMNYNEVVDASNISYDSNYVWIYEDNNYPKLFIDDINMSIASININQHSWTNVRYSNLESIILTSNITYNVTEISVLNPIVSSYYYLHNSSTPLSELELESVEWNTYEGTSTIAEEGFYIIYVKVIDMYDNVYYLNSDLLILDKSEGIVSIGMDDNSWNTVVDDPAYKYVNESKDILVEASDLLSGVANIEYYISDGKLTREELENLEEWNTYNEGISYSSTTPNIVYVKLTDNAGFITYASTDYILLSGYSENNMTIGRYTENNLNNVNITNKSSLTFNYTYISSNSYIASDAHSVISNIELPINTELTLIDNKSSDVYKYTVVGNDYLAIGVNYVYPFELFTTLKLNSDDYYLDQINEEIDEDFSLIIDFAKTNINTNYENVAISLGILENNNIVRETLGSTKKTFNIYSNVNGENVKATNYISSNYDGTSITYNANATMNINITTGINYKNINSSIIYDTTLENKNIGLQLKLVDDSNNIVSKEYLKNVLISVNGIEYSSNDKGIFKINLEGLENNTDLLTIKTSRDNLKLLSGNYYFKISSFVSYDGLNTDSELVDSIIIPVSVTSNRENKNYIFDISMDETKKIIDKSAASTIIKYSIKEKGNFTNPSIRVSLYEKDTLSGYDQSYTKIDLQDYVLTELELCDDNTYYAIKNPVSYMGTEESINEFEINLLSNTLTNKAYKVIFDLYDGNKLISSEEENFIVK